MRVSDGSWLTWRIAADRVAEQPVVAELVVFDHRQHDRRRADLQIGRDLAHVGVADDHVEAAVLLRIAVRFVAGVDDRALERRLEADLLLEEVGSLAELVGTSSGDTPGQLAAHLARTAEDLTGDEVRRDLRGDPTERELTGEQVVLVAAVAVALAVGVVLVDDELATGGDERARVVHRRPHDLLGGAVPDAPPRRAFDTSGVEISGWA